MPLSLRSRSRTGSGRRLRTVALAATLSITAGIIGLPGSSAAATAVAPGQCPAIWPTADVVQGTIGRGWTVVQGHTPVPFRVQFVGLLVDAFSNGNDLIIVRVSDLPGSHFIRDAHGIWAGISGSPVYREGKLVGSVSYSLNSGEAFIAGVTPAEDIVKVLDYPGASANDALGEDHVRIPASLRPTLLRYGGPAAAAATSFDRLRLPLAVSGLDKRGRDRLQKDYDERGIPVMVVPGASAPVPTDTFGVPVPGGNFAGVISYGQVTAAGIGTTTYVCGDQALAFGHPLTFSGKSTFGANDAEAIAIIPGIASSYKLANITDTMGIVDQDRFSGIRARLGTAPNATPIMTDLTDDTSGAHRMGETDVTSQDFIVGLIPSHLLSAFDAVLDHFGKGTAALHWVIKGHRGGGHSFTLERGDRYASPGDIAFESFEGVFDDAIEIAQNPFEDVTFDSIEVTGHITESYAPYVMQRLKISKNGGPFLERESLNIHPGDSLVIRSFLQRYHGDVRTVDQTLVVHPTTAHDGLLFVGRTDEFGQIQAASFHELIVALRTQARRDDLQARIVMFDFAGEQENASGSVRLDSVINGNIVIPVTVP